MRKLLFGILFMVLSLGGGATTLAVRSKPVAPKITQQVQMQPGDQTKKQIRDVTYAITSSNSICSATAIGPHTLLTANHCVDKVGDIHGLKNQNDELGTAVVTRADPSRELATLETEYTFPRYASISSQEALQDTQIYLAGYPLGIGETVTEGFVQGLQAYSSVPNGLFYYVTVPVAPGNSGGGMFVVDPKGEILLTGVTSMMGVGGREGQSNYAFIVSEKTINEFLR